MLLFTTAVFLTKLAVINPLPLQVKIQLLFEDETPLQRFQQSHFFHLRDVAFHFQQ